MPHTKFRGNRPTGSGEEDFRVVLTTHRWRPSWSCDLDFANKLSSPLPMHAPHKISTLIGQAVSERSLKSVYGQQTGQGQEMTLTYINHIPSSTTLVVCIYHFSGLRLQ